MGPVQRGRFRPLLERGLLRDDSHVSLKEPMVIDFTLEQEAPSAGQEVRMLGLAPSCVLVRCTWAGRVFVPMAMTRLEPHMRITAVIAPEAEGLTILRHGCKEEKRY